MYLIFHPVSIVRTFTNYHVKFAWKFPAHWLIDIFCKEKNPDRKLMCQFQLMLNMNRFKDCWVTKESQSTLHIHVLQTTHSDFPFQIIIWCLIYTCNASFRFNKNWISPDDARFAICFWFYCWSARGIPCLQQKMQWLILFLLLSHKCVLWVS